MNYKHIFFVALMVLVPWSASAVFLSGERIVTDGPQTENVYAAGQVVTIDHPVDGDVFVAGQIVEINAPVVGDVFMAAQNITISADVGGDVRGFAQDVVIDSAIGGEIISGGEDVTFMKGSQVGGSVYVGAEDLTINAPIAGNLVSSAEDVLFGADARIAGTVDLYETSRSDVQYLAQDIESKATFHEGSGKHISYQRAEDTPKILLAAVIGILMGLGFAVFYPLLLMLCGGRHIQKMSELDVKAFLVRAGIGCASALFVPALIVACAVTVIGIPLGVFLLLLAIMVVLVAMPLASIMLGACAIRLWQHITGKGQTRTVGLSRWQIAVVGGVSMFVITLIPGIGALVFLVFFCASVGSLCVFLYHAIKNARA